ncbi:hypothetical protein V8C42DRAFT_339599 [Trichoderma barbatum]
MEHLDLPIALRRSRRYSTRVNVKSEVSPDVSTPPQTPHRRKRAARFSDPGPSMISSGLTPMVRHTSLATPRSRRSTPRMNRQPVALNLRQTVDGRVERRMRRNGLRDLLNKMEQEKRRKEQSAQAEIAKLKAEVRARDGEIYDLQNATVIMDTERIWLLERQVEELKDELASRSSAKEGVTQYYSWAKTPSDASTDEVMDMARDEDHFGDSTMLQLQLSTPSRAKSSFMTPPATSPAKPASPCSQHASPSSQHASPTPASRDAPLHSPDSDKQLLEEEIISLQFEVHKLTATVDSYHALGERISDALSNGPSDGGACSTLEAIENQVQLLLQTMASRAAAASHLTSAISRLGFPGDDASEMVLSLAAGFRAARLELEYLTPGEITLPLTSHGAEVLDLLLMRLRDLTKKSKEDDELIDEYIEIEQSLRKRLNARGLPKNAAIDELEAQIEDAVEQTAELLKEMCTTETRLTRQAGTMSRQRGMALALRDARVSELPGEIDRANESLWAAHDMIRALRVENSVMKVRWKKRRRKPKTP